MIRKFSIALLAAAALGGCASYGYSGGDGDYYYGSPGVDYYGAPYGSVGYGTGGRWYGSAGYGYGYGTGYPGYGYYGGYYPPYYYYPRPVRPPVSPRPPRGPDYVLPDNGTRYPGRGRDGALGRPAVVGEAGPGGGAVRGGVISRGYEQGMRPPQGRLRAPQGSPMPGDYQGRGRAGAYPSQAPAPQQQRGGMDRRPSAQPMRSAPQQRQESRSAPASRPSSPNRDDRRSREP